MRYAVGSRCSLKKNNKSFFDWRIFALFFFFVAVAAIILIRLYFLQVVSYDSYSALAGEQHTLSKKLVPKRGEIFLKGGSAISGGQENYPAAINRDAKMAYAVPAEIENYSEAAEKLAEILQLDKNYLEEKLNKPGDMYEPLKHRLTDEEIGRVNGLKFKGVHLVDESYRYYPYKELAANILGFVGWKGDVFGGKYGLESYFEKQFKGEDGQITQNRDASGRKIFLGENELISAKDGNSLILTINYAIQYEAEKILKGAIEKYGAEKGVIIVSEPESGKILAMANFPSFDPNEYSKVEDIGVFRNLAVSEPYECGSIFKPFTMAAGIDSGKISPDTSYNDTGKVVEAGYMIQNSDLKSYGMQTMTQALEKSLNTGVIYVEKLLGNKNFYEYVKRFGFGEATGIDLAGENQGSIKNLENLKITIQHFTASFGQGITVTPIQLASAYGALANGGILMKPQIVDKIIHGDGREEIIEPKEIRRVVSERAALEVGKMLRSVVVNGHGKRADVPGYAVAGKTGTAQIASEDKQGYEEGKNIGSFAGFAPLQNPKFAVLVRIDKPTNVEWAESSAAPAFGELMKFLLEYANIEPTEEYSQADLDKFDAEHVLRKFLMEKQEEEKKNKEAEKDKDKNK